MSCWQVASCAWADTRTLDDYLADRWEPFAVTERRGEATVWLRREAEHLAAQSGAPRLRPEREAVRLAESTE
jgi:hypothetical protein